MRTCDCGGSAVGLLLWSSNSLVHMLNMRSLQRFTLAAELLTNASKQEKTCTLVGQPHQLLHLWLRGLVLL